MALGCCRVFGVEGLGFRVRDRVCFGLGVRAFGPEFLHPKRSIHKTSFPALDVDIPIVILGAMGKILALSPALPTTL